MYTRLQNETQMEVSNMKNTENDIGMPNKQTHYINSAKQPIEILQSIFTPKEFQAFCFGNELKYRMRADYKGQEESDMHKAIVYNYWRKLSKEGHTINPVKDIPPKDYKYDFFMWFIYIWQITTYYDRI